MMESIFVNDYYKIMDAARSKGKLFDCAFAAKMMKERYPEITYEEYCDILPSWPQLYSKADIPFMAAAFNQFIKLWIDKYAPKHILIPFANGRECLIPKQGEIIKYRFLNKQLEEAAKIFYQIDTIETIPSSGTYDFIFSDLPFGPINDKFIAYSVFDNYVGILADDGYCAFTFPNGLCMSNGVKWLKRLEDKGLFCNAILDMPSNSYSPITAVETVVGVFSKHKTERLFVGLLADEPMTSVIIDNFKKNQESKTNPKMGVYLDADIYCYADYAKKIGIQKRNKAFEKNHNAVIVKMSDIGEVHAPDKDHKFKDDANSVFIPKLGNSDVVTSEKEFHIKAQNYFQVIVDDTKILPRYLAFFLNTEDGLKLRQMYYKGTTIKALNTQIIMDMEIPCPKIEFQAEYLATFEELEVLRIEVDGLKDRLQKTPASYKNIRKEMKNINNRGDRFIQWIETLPYPIATILKRYSVTDDSSKRQEMLFYFFEAYSIFESTILSAALDKQRIDCSSLNNVDPSFFEKASIGNWVRMDRALSNLYLNMMNGNDDALKKVALSCFHTEDETLVKYLCNKAVCNVLEQASEKRNLWKGHGGITSESIYKDHVDTLDSLMRKLQDNTKDLFERIRLVRPLSLSYSDGVFTNKVEVLTGSNAIFNKDEIISIQALDDKKLYIQMMDTGELLELPPYFILKNSPADVKNACYFYSRVEGGNTRYVSYHFEGEPEDMESGEAAFDIIKRLLTN